MFTEAKVFITPTRDTDNSYPHDIEFTVLNNERFVITIDNRELTFKCSDLKRIIDVSAIVSNGDS